MSDETSNGIFRFNSPVRIGFVDLYQPRRFGPKGKEKGDPKYGVWALLTPDHPDLAAIRETITRVAREKWPGVNLTELSKPFKMGDKVIADHNAKLARESKAPDGKYDFVKGLVIIPAKSQFQPVLGVLANNAILELTDPALKTANQNKFYPGVEALVELNFVSFNRTRPDDKDGVTAYLNSVLSLGRGERFKGTGNSIAESFSGYLGATSQVDPTAGLDNGDDPFA